MVTRQQTKPQSRAQVRATEKTEKEQAGLSDSHITPEAFNALYEKTMQKYSHWTFEKIYEETERQVIERFGKRKYSSADSFRQIRKRLIKK